MRNTATVVGYVVCHFWVSLTLRVKSSLFCYSSYCVKESTHTKKSELELRNKHTAIRPPRFAVALQYRSIPGATPTLATTTMRIPFRRWEPCVIDAIADKLCTAVGEGATRAVSKIPRGESSASQSHSSLAQTKAR